MKIQKIVLFTYLHFQLIPAICFGQADSTNYFFDVEGLICKENKAIYVAKGIKENNKTKLVYYVKKSGARVMEATYTDSTLAIKDGYFALYHETGLDIKKGLYINNQLDGLWLHWDWEKFTDSIVYKDGKDIMHVTFAYYLDGKLFSRELKELNPQKVELTVYDKNGNIERKSKWINGTGDQIYYYPNGQAKKVESYKNKKVTNISYFKPDGSSISEKGFKKEETAFVEYYEKLKGIKNSSSNNAPTYPGGDAAFFSFFKSNFKGRNTKPGHEIEAITVVFNLDKAGFANNIRVVGGSTRDMEIEVLSVFKRMSPWNMNGHKEFGPVTYTLSLTGF